MQLICPKCGSRFEMEQAVKELEQKETHDIAANLGVHWRLVNEYAECHRQSEYGDLRLATKLRIYKTIARLIETGAFSYRGKRYRSSEPEIIRAMTEICNRQKWGFTNDNYLYSILAKTAEGLSAEGLSAREEQRRESLRRAQGDSPRESEPGKVDFKRLATDARRQTRIEK